MARRMFRVSARIADDGLCTIGMLRLAKLQSLTVNSMYMHGSPASL